MSTYKITNVTNLAGKRDFKYNSELEIQVVDNMVKKTIKVKPGDSVFLTVSSLPLSVHRLRVKRLVTVVEVSPNDIPKKAKKTKPVSPKKKEVKSVAKKSVAKKKPVIKKPTKKPVKKAVASKATDIEKDM